MQFFKIKSGFSQQLCMTFLSSLLLQGCQNAPSNDALISSTKPISKSLAAKFSSENTKLIESGIQDLIEGRYEEAGHLFNQALNNDPTNTWIHYLNGLRYHMVARQGDYSSYDLAKAGYEQSLKFDPLNTSASLQLGRVYAERKEYIQAQNEFANILLTKPNDYDALYEMACASYYSGDIKTAHMAIVRAQKIKPDQPEARKAAAMILAAAGKNDLALQELQSYQQLSHNSQDAKRLEGRIQDWRQLYQKGLVLAQATDGTEGTSEALDVSREKDSAAPDLTKDTTTTAVAKAGAESAFAPPADGSDASTASADTAATPVPGAGEMIVFDAIVMRVSDVGNTSKGQNILENFSLTISPGTHMRARTNSPYTVGIASGQNGSYLGTQVASPNATSVKSNTVPASSMGFTVNQAADAGNSLSYTRLFAQGIAFNNFLYSLNIANASKTYIEVVGRPSLVASIGKPAKFFSGTELVAGLSGDNGGNLVKSPVGVTLEIVPVSMKDNKVIFDVTLYGALLTESDMAELGNTSNITQQWTAIGISKINTSVEIPLGETILLGGMTERIDEKGKSGVPFLQNIPLIQYFFSNETTYSERKSIMYLITPRTYDSNKRKIQSENSLRKRLTPNLQELEVKNADWYAPDYNMSVTLMHLAPLYREYRTGDLDPIQWDFEKHFDEWVREVKSFLYY